MHEMKVAFLAATMTGVSAPISIDAAHLAAAAAHTGARPQSDTESLIRLTTTHNHS